MSSLDNFQQALEALRQQQNPEKFMSDMNNWVCVHATRYMPPRNPDGTMFIPSTAMATDFDIPRNTVHTTLNHVVKSHSMGGWEDCPYVILIPYKDLVAINGDPSSVSLFDTYFTPDPERGLVLPPSAYLVQPSENCFYEIGEHGATYKNSNYTREEKEFILSLMTNDDFEKYQQFTTYSLTQDLTSFYFDIDVPDDNQRYELLRTKYKDQLDKMAQDLLSSYLRNYVTSLAMEKHGFTYISSENEYNASDTVCNTAEQHGLSFNVNNTGHSGSIEYEMEYVWHYLCKTIESTSSATIEDLYNKWVSNPCEEYSKSFMFHHETPDYPKIQINILKSIVNDEPLHCYQQYCEKFANLVQERGKKFKTIAEYSPALDTVLRRNSQKMEIEWQNAVAKFKQNPRYVLFEKLAKQVLDTYSKMKPHDHVIFPIMPPSFVPLDKALNSDNTMQMPIGPMMPPPKPYNM